MQLINQKTYRLEFLILKVIELSKVPSCTGNTLPPLPQYSPQNRWKTDEPLSSKGRRESAASRDNLYTDVSPSKGQKMYHLDKYII